MSIKSLNKVFLIGNVGKEPEITTLQNGNKIARLSLATNEDYKNSNGEWVQNTQWHTINVFSKGLVKLIEEKVKKGAVLHLEGSIEYRVSEKDGKKAYFTQINLQQFNSSLTILTNGSEEENN